VVHFGAWKLWGAFDAAMACSGDAAMACRGDGVLVA